MKTFPLVPIALGLSLWALSRIAYATLAPGVPDSGILPVAAVPLAFPLYGASPLWSSFDMLIVWGLACSLFILPQLAAFARAKTRRDILWSVAITFAEWLLCVWRLRSLSYSDYDYRFSFAVLTLAVLLSIGAAFGQLFQYANDNRRKA